MVVNELFLDSATLRDNVVSLAKQLGYSPKSITASTATVDLNLQFQGTSPAAVTFKAGSGFVTNFDNSLYQFILSEDHRTEVVNSVATFEDLPIHEGSLVTTRTVVNTSLKEQRFIIANASADVSTIKIKVFQNANSTVYDTYEEATNILEVSSDDKIFFISETEDEKKRLAGLEGQI